MLKVPQLPESEPFTGSVYLGAPESGLITKPPYTIYVVANSERYGVSVRLKAEVFPDERPGRSRRCSTKPPNSRSAS